MKRKKKKITRIPVCKCGNIQELALKNGKCFECNGGRPE